MYTTCNSKPAIKFLKLLPSNFLNNYCCFAALQNRSGALASVDLWYDWKRGYNLNLIQKQLGSTLWDLEWSNHTSFYFDKQAQTCKVHFQLCLTSNKCNNDEFDCTALSRMTQNFCYLHGAL